MSESDRNEQEIELTLQHLRRPELDREAITLLVIRLSELRNPESQVVLVADNELKKIHSDGTSDSMYLNNLWTECERSPERRAEIVDSYVRVLWKEKENGSDEALKRQNVVAIVRDSNYRDFVTLEVQEKSTVHLCGDLWIIYATDKPDLTAVLMGKEIEFLNLDPETLHDVAVENLSRLLANLSFTTYGECFVISTENLEYASSALLLEFVWESAAALVDGDLIVGVPARDTVLFTGSTNVRGIQELRDQVNYVIRNGHHLISETLLRRQGREWIVFS